MALTKAEVVERLGRRKTEAVFVQELGESVLMRSPTFTEWHELVRQHRAIPAGAEPGSRLMAETVAVALANEDGSRMFGPDEVDQVAAMPPEFIMKTYVAAWSTVLRGVHSEADEKKA